MNNFHIDLHIDDGDFNFNDVLSPAQLTEASVIAQDIKHRVLESGILVRLVGLRNQNGIAPLLVELELEVELDERLVPGTINITRSDDYSLTIEAETKHYGGLSLAVSS